MAEPGVRVGGVRVACRPSGGGYYECLATVRASGMGQTATLRQSMNATDTYGYARWHTTGNPF